MNILYVNDDGNTDYYLLSNSKGEYHLSTEKYNKLGKDKAIELATKEINKKIELKQYSNVTINFDQARELGFCEYGIKDFCKRLKLDIDATYSIFYLYNLLDLHTFLEYPNECLKLFTNKLFNKFGGLVKLLDQNRSRRVLNLVINKGNISDNILHELSYKSALRVINNFEKMYPNDDRPRKAIEAKKKYIEGKINKEELSAVESAAWSAAWSAESAAESAAWSAAESAAWSAESAAESAAWSAESAAESAAWSAAWSAESAARSAELNFQIDTLIEILKGENDE